MDNELVSLREVDAAPINIGTAPAGKLAVSPIKKTAPPGKWAVSPASGTTLPDIRSVLPATGTVPPGK